MVQGRIKAFIIKVQKIDGKCVEHARCAAVAGELYKLDDDGYLDPDEVSAPPNLESQARRGARACPEKAMAVIEG